MAENPNNKHNLPLSDQESLKEKIELQENLKREIELQQMKRLENVECYRIYAHDPSEDDKKREIDQKRIN